MNNKAVKHLMQADYRLAAVINTLGDIEIHHYSNPFRFLVGEIIGQMISNNVRKVIVDRLVKLCGGLITPDTILSHTKEEIRATGMSSAKADYLLNLADLTKHGQIDFDKLSRMDDSQIISSLRSIKGVGDWTAKMFLIFYLERDNVLPYEDGAFVQAYKWLYNARSLKHQSITRRCKCWKPFSSYGARYLYAALDSGLTKQDVKEFLAIYNNI